MASSAAGAGEASGETPASLRMSAELALRSEDQAGLLSEACRLAAAALRTDCVQVLIGSAGQAMPPGTLATRVLQTSGPFVATSASEFAPPGHPVTGGVQSSAAVPLWLDVEARGMRSSGLPPDAVLQADSHAPRSWSEHDIATLDGYAALIGTLLQRVQTGRQDREEISRLSSALQASEADSAQRTHELVAANAKLQAELAQRRRMEDLLRQSHKMDAMGKLTGGVAHDFNNLLQGICGSLELMQVRASQGRGAEMGNYIETALASANRAALLASRLLTFSQRRPFEPLPSKLSHLVAGMEELFRRTVGPMIRIETRHATELWPSLCDPNQIETALLDLVINARDAMPDGGTILIETANVFATRQSVTQADLPPGEYVALTVTDTGTGMPAAVQADAFEAFFTTKPSGEGAGLGLAMVRGLVEQAGGLVQLRSMVGEGTTVAIYLPRFLGLVNEAELAADPGKVVAKTSVLVVDDEPAARMFVSDVLSDAGYSVMEAHDSRSGLHALDSEARIDLMVTDVGLPGGMNGRQLAAAARQLRPGLKVLFVTGYEEAAATRNNLLEEGVLVMTKPFGMEALKATVQGIIGH